MKYITLLIGMLHFYSLFSQSKILHLSFHQGCVNVIEELARELNLDIKTYNVLQNSFLADDDDLNGIYNITYERANSIWEKHKNFFNSFDAIITSDITPLSRIFLQNNWKKPLIVWVCNRFDWNINPDTDGAYYKTIQEAISLSNITFIASTPYEHIHARKKGINLGTCTLSPIGSKESKIVNSSIPQNINKSETIMIISRALWKLAQTKQHIIDECNKRKIKTYFGKYNGPNDLVQFKGIIFIPYVYANWTLFENIMNGIIHFIPTEKFLLDIFDVKDATTREKMLYIFKHCEWYREENRDLFVYFDSWDDLEIKIKTTNYSLLKNHIITKAFKNHDEIVGKWQIIFKEFGLL